MQTRQYGCITWSLGVECGVWRYWAWNQRIIWKHRRRERGNQSIVSMAGYNKTYISQNLVKLKTNSRNCSSLMLSRVPMTKYANSQGISQPAGDRTRDTVRCRYSAKWPHVYMNIIYPLPRVWWDDTSRWTWSYCWSNISIAETHRIPTLPCPARMSGLNYCWI